MYLRNIATVYVFHNKHILLMHRVGSRLFSGDIWVGPGGHFEPGELDDPAACALRELREETGLTAADVTGLRLKYITTRRAANEIRQQYIFVCYLKNPAATLTANEEGRLEWVPLAGLFDRKMAFSNTHCLCNSVLKNTSPVLYRNGKLMYHLQYPGPPQTCDSDYNSIRHLLSAKENDAVYSVALGEADGAPAAQFTELKEYSTAY